ncbi:MAG: hypothetical protein M1816_003263 [Peltula sp. TS41687]|nr:MAG: hypothetical protein M1816_003263 [Peltula sp. TS41687]
MSARFTSWRWHAIAISVSTLYLSALAQGSSENNFAANFSDTPQPFTLNVDRDFIAVTKLKASLTRYTKNINVTDFSEGPPQHNVSTIRDYWVNNYTWSEEEASINRQFRQFTTTVHAGPNYTYPIPLHFVHHRSDRADAIPLLFLHGWPGSFLEVGKIIEPLVNPPNSSVTAFHVVAPSLPGFGFSPAPEQPSLGLRQTGQGCNDLMMQLGYTKYVIQGGDLGAFTLRFMAVDFPSSVRAIHTNFWWSAPTPADRAANQAGNNTAEERAYIEALDWYANNGNGYQQIQQKAPLQLAVALTDSPVGFAIWIYQLMQTISDMYPWTPREIITWAMMYYIQGPYGGFRTYRELTHPGETVWLEEWGYISQPVGISNFGKQILLAPLPWAQRKGNVVYFQYHDRGGHFASHEVPDLLVGDIRAFLALGTVASQAYLKED